MQTQDTDPGYTIMISSGLTPVVSTPGFRGTYTTRRKATLIAKAMQANGRKTAYVYPKTKSPHAHSFRARVALMAQLVLKPVDPPLNGYDYANHEWLEYLESEAIDLGYTIIELDPKDHLQDDGWEGGNG